MDFSFLPNIFEVSMARGLLTKLSRVLIIEIKD